VRATLALLASLAAALTLGGCAYKPLKAPCSPNEGGTPLAYTDLPPPSPAATAIRAVDSCGPMRPI
jgi:hypothetical protein